MAVFFDGIDDNLSTAQDAASTAIDGNLTTHAIFLFLPSTPASTQTILSSSDGYPGTGSRGLKTGTDSKFQFFHSFSGTTPFWRTSSAQTVGVWHQFVVTYDASSLSNDPLMWVDNASVSLNDLTPSGSRITGFDSFRLGSDRSGGQVCACTLAFICLESGALWDAARINRHYWYGAPGGGIELVYPLLTNDYTNKGTVNGATLVANNGPVTVSSITNALKGFVLLRSCT